MDEKVDHDFSLIAPPYVHHSPVKASIAASFFVNSGDSIASWLARLTAWTREVPARLQWGPLAYLAAPFFYLE